MSTTPEPPAPPAERGYRRLSPLTPVVRAPIVVLAFVGASWQQMLDGERGYTWALPVLLVAGAVYGVASWVRTRFWIDGDELRIDTGVLFRQSRRIRIDRLQGIDIVQPLVARIFGLAELRFDLASGSDREGSLAFLPTEDARALRRTLLARRQQVRGAGHVGADPVHPPADRPLVAPADGPVEGPAWGPVEGPVERLVEEPVEAPERPLSRIDLGRLLASLAASTETLVLGGGAVIFVVIAQLSGNPAATVGGVLPALLAMGLSLGRKLTSYYDFTLSRSAEGLHVRRGLTSLSSQTIAMRRIQGLVVTEPWLWRPFGWARLDVSVAGYQTSDSDSAQASSTLMPVAPRAEIFGLVREVLGGRDVTDVPLQPPPRRARWLAPLTAWTMALGQSEDLVVSRRGFFARRLDLVPQERVQSVRAHQGPLQRRLRLADVHVDSPPGPVHVVGLLREPSEARAFVEQTVVRSMRARSRLPVLQPPVNGEDTSPTAWTTQE